MTDKTMQETLTSQITMEHTRNIIDDFKKDIEEVKTRIMDLISGRVKTLDPKTGGVKTEVDGTMTPLNKKDKNWMRMILDSKMNFNKIMSNYDIDDVNNRSYFFELEMIKFFYSREYIPMKDKGLYVDIISEQIFDTMKRAYQGLERSIIFSAVKLIQTEQSYGGQPDADKGIKGLFGLMGKK